MKSCGWTAAVAMAAALAGCGGGGGNPGECHGGTEVCTGVQPGGGSTAADSAVGLFKGTTGSGRLVYSLVRDNGEIWLLHGNGTALVGAELGTYTAASGGISSPNLVDFNTDSSTVTQGTLAGNYATRSTLAATVSLPSAVTTFSALYDSTSTTQGTLASLAGTYTGTASVAGDSRAATATVTSTGVITGSTANACNFSGNLLADAGVSSFSVTLTFTGAACPQTPSLSSGAGVAVLDGTRLQLAVFNAGKTQGFAFSGGR